MRTVRRRWWLIPVVPLLLVAFVAGGFVVWASTPLGPAPEALAALASDSQVTVTHSATHGRWWVFEPAQGLPVAGLIFYPGGRVDPRSYAPLAHDIAAQGYRVVVTPMPLNMAFFAPNRADDVLAAYPDTDVWVVGGHSLGGAMAARYVYSKGNALPVDGLALWAAYPAATDNLALRVDLAVLSISATRDGLMTTEERETSRTLLPADTCWVILEGGNHAQFGAYGPQPGDNTATLPVVTQWQQITEATGDFMGQLVGVALGANDFPDCLRIRGAG